MRARTGVCVCVCARVRHASRTSVPLCASLYQHAYIYISVRVCLLVALFVCDDNPPRPSHIQPGRKVLAMIKPPILEPSSATSDLNRENL